MPEKRKETCYTHMSLKCKSRKIQWPTKHQYVFQNYRKYRFKGYESQVETLKALESINFEITPGKLRL